MILVPVVIQYFFLNRWRWRCQKKIVYKKIFIKCVRTTTHSAIRPHPPCMNISLAGCEDSDLHPGSEEIFGATWRTTRGRTARHTHRKPSTFRRRFSPPRPPFLIIINRVNRLTATRAVWCTVWGIGGVRSVLCEKDARVGDPQVRRYQKCTGTLMERVRARRSTTTRACRLSVRHNTMRERATGGGRLRPGRRVGMPVNPPADRPDGDLAVDGHRRVSTRGRRHVRADTTAPARLLILAGVCLVKMHSSRTFAFVVDPPDKTIKDMLLNVSSTCGGLALDETGVGPFPESNSSVRNLMVNADGGAPPPLALTARCSRAAGSKRVEPS